ncbi:MAG TPA: anhydro-N-acetylmuramic acid kinase [Tepidisphaeraceae bacterium]
MSSRLIAGAMSGTSADGVDVAIGEIEGRGLDMTARLVHHEQHPYSEDLRRAIHAIRERGEAKLSELARCAREISLHYAVAVRQALALANLTASDLAAVAAHGQTLFHDPPNTIQWLDPALLAAEVGCQVISDFRRADCAAGGQGAPLVPFADYILFRDATKHRVLLNVGGIANLTYLPAAGSIDQLVAFDTGPGNCVSDWLCREMDPQGPGFDADGARARRGQVLSEICDRFLGHPYFDAAPPKSTDGPAMIAAFQQAMAGREYPLNDLLATAAWLTATTIAVACGNHAESHSIDLIASGGGTRNKAIMAQLASAFPPDTRICTTSEFNIPADAKEAIAFALLGAATLDGVPANVPSCTGARRAVVLGSITA